MENPFRCKTCGRSFPDQEGAAACEEQGQAHKLSVGAAVEFRFHDPDLANGQWVPGTVYEVDFRYGDHRPLYTVEITPELATEYGMDPDSPYVGTYPEDGDLFRAAA